MKNILITGAAGFIGSHITDLFCKQGYNPICFIKNSTDKSFIKDLPITVKYGNILDYDKLYNALENVHCVIHVAALTRDWGSYEDFYNINVHGTMKVLKAGVAQGVRQFVVIGSISSYGEENSNKIKDENAPYNAHYPYFLDSVFPCKMNYYRDTKSLSTKMAIEFAESNEINLTVIEPVWVYGEREFHSGFYEYMKMVRSGMLLLPGCKLNNFHVVYVRDLAKAIYKAFSKNIPGTHRFIIGNKQSERMDRIFQLFCKEMGKTKPMNISKSVIYPIGFLMELAYTILGMKHAPALTRARVNMFYDNIEYNCEKARKELAYTNEYSIEEGIRSTVDWYKKRKLI
jgi:nucleoside-diphosphate-sugar epimerase